MRLSVFLAPPSPQAPHPPFDVALVVDVLRASSALAAAAAAGVGRVLLAGSPAEALAYRERAPGALLGGERRSLPIAGFDFGNSPREYASSPRLAGATLVFTSTNGSDAARAIRARRRVFAAFVNGAAAVRAVGDAGTVAIVAAGASGRPALEDMAGAGWLLRRLLEAGARGPLGSAARAALAIAPRDADGVRVLVRGSDHARALRAHGRAGADDVDFCARIDVLDAAGAAELLDTAAG